ncbi:ABC transporter ATP-binding protein [Tritonibacter mobilis]|uniref:ABC transporter ATP-binding protein n=1 Tax=Tritonibacter mobilis TaxID=379347 RepID=UPI000806A983|nr:ABC transporter ATP-binding protein [Tritonibacter mobilis]MBU3033865.1 ABC transporter ATP-binding protein [Tritonibacter mobilis]NHM19595.1 ABC transporter ATP-binding protein [Tritonibacter mobilis]NHM23744.1 ABC transporter ATP-binding protein [Tritonibacter mobilis]WHQ84917.1 ABC transporter ATP-binding protein [Tritonibacter mobilis]
MATVTLRGIRKNFKETEVLRGIDLAIADGEFVSLVGPSGCGKSTLLRIIAGLESASGGSIEIGGAPVDRLRAADRNLSMVFQSYALYPHLTVAENIAVPLRMRQLNTAQRLPLIGRAVPGARERGREIDARVLEAAKTLEIDQLLDRKPGQLSGGQRQRVALGRALVRAPAAFLLDEPLSNLDAKLRVHTRTEIAELHRRLAATFIYVTHDQVEAMTMSSRIAVMMGGEILQCDAPTRIYEDPNDLRVAEFIGSPRINVLPAESDSSGRISVLGKGLPLALHEGRQTLQLALRPEALSLTHHTPLLQGRVVHAENLGHEVFVQISLDGAEQRVVLRTDPAMQAQLHLGAKVGLTFDPNRALIFDAKGQRQRNLLRALQEIPA